MQVILDSSFARPGSAPIWGGKKGEFRDWTRGGGGGGLADPSFTAPLADTEHEKSVILLKLIIYSLQAPL